MKIALVIAMLAMLLLAGCARKEFVAELQGVTSPSSLIPHELLSEAFNATNLSLAPSLAPEGCFCIIYGVSQGEKIDFKVQALDGRCSVPYSELFPKGQKWLPEEFDEVFVRLQCPVVVS